MDVCFLTDKDVLYIVLANENLKIILCTNDISLSYSNLDWISKAIRSTIKGVNRIRIINETSWQLLITKSVPRHFSLLHPVTSNYLSNMSLWSSLSGRNPFRELSSSVNIIMLRQKFRRYEHVCVCVLGEDWVVSRREVTRCWADFVM